MFRRRGSNCNPGDWREKPLLCELDNGWLWRRCCVVLGVSGAQPYYPGYYRIVFSQSGPAKNGRPNRRPRMGKKGGSNEKAPVSKQ